MFKEILSIRRRNKHAETLQWKATTQPTRNREKKEFR